MEKYFVIQSNEDGGFYIEEFDNVEQVLSDTMENLECNVTYHSKIPSKYSEGWNNDAIIIKGKIVTPQPKEVVTKYEIY